MMTLFNFGFNSNKILKHLFFIYLSSISLLHFPND
ncbi:unnamed protein product [Paramecium primaurelia]|uniref:Uncharacterized protein n=1 Tax=Paramecium primaurelia TaxID=5886 RepID=A0A8S1PZ30_PARPR|nr:unnamed protein product [Paramecium primaurelia]